ncbi:unnamed protein product [Spirodela intermedia]|uniref:Uncharacterized protein n=1 Tax=Spirodela intermedia TaxID=51605 RepID=A0A7I8IPJ5_SPIIN|nr:unnamed protein product [Spirodela intermedia]CAA6659720.1 unnamed protein product [Spirodela intermedia]
MPGEREAGSNESTALEGFQTAAVGSRRQDREGGRRWSLEGEEKFFRRGAGKRLQVVAPAVAFRTTLSLKGRHWARGSSCGACADKLWPRRPHERGGTFVMEGEEKVHILFTREGPLKPPVLVSSPWLDQLATVSLP